MKYLSSCKLGELYRFAYNVHAYIKKDNCVQAAAVGEFTVPTVRLLKQIMSIDPKHTNTNKPFVLLLRDSDVAVISFLDGTIRYVNVHTKVYKA